MPSPLVVRIRGGLGNQLFQYASARGIAASIGRPLRVDARTAFARDPYRRAYRLDRIGRPPEEASWMEIGWARARSIQRWRSWRVLETQEMLARGISYQSALATKAVPRYLEAYLQSPRYFEALASDLRAELMPAIERRGADFEQISRTPHAVALHVRRKDYSPVLPASYYRAAVERLRKDVPDAHFFVLGDDPEWVERELAWLTPRTALASEGPDADLRDLALIAACRHRIIANSSFSWWGAWLSSHEGATLAPSQWWVGAPRPRDLFPRSWYVLDEGVCA